MKMTQKLANDLMDCLYCLACSANGRMPETEEEEAMAMDYVRETFLALCEGWEATTGEEWEVIEEEEEKPPNFS